jgi:hypothetical protein
MAGDFSSLPPYRGLPDPPMKERDRDDTRPRWSATDMVVMAVIVVLLIILGIDYYLSHLFGNNFPALEGP